MAERDVETLTVPLGARGYDIRIGPGLIARAGAEIAARLGRPRLAVVADETVAALHLAALRGGLADAGLESAPVVLAEGEATKSVAHYDRLTDELLRLGIARDDAVIAFGGGVIGDLAGFAAATLRRGAALIQIPTTLLAQVDSAVGGKTGINSPRGKNLIGAFHQPRLVLCDTGALATLPTRDLLSGYAEVVKYGALGDAEFFAWLEGAGPSIRSGDAAARAYAVRRSCEIKAGIVGRDETERGERALLNLGHTFGHALEAATGYSGRLLHGEGVAIGMGLAFELSRRLGLCPPEAPARLGAHLATMGMKARLADIPGDLPDADALLALMAQDKKVEAGRLVFILARDLGAAFIAREVDPRAARAVLADALAAR